MKRFFAGAWAEGLGVALVLVALGYFYFWPASLRLGFGVPGAIMSEGGDATILPFLYDAVARLLREKPSWLLYGAVPIVGLDPPESGAHWIPYLERWVVALLGQRLPAENLSTAFVFVATVLNGALFHGFSRSLGWSRPLALAIGIAFAFNPFSLARAQAHPALVGIYYLPAIFWGIHLSVGRSSSKSLAGAAGLFVLAAATAHYYWMCGLVMAPFFLAFALARPSVAVPGPMLRGLARLGVAVLPALLLMGWTLLAKTPPDFVGGKVREPQPDFQYVQRYGARPVDYLTGALLTTPSEWNPLRAGLNRGVWADWDGSNPVERSNGIRWLVLLAAAVAFGRGLRGRLGESDQKLVGFFALYGLMMLACSLPPGLGPSEWAFRWIPNLRVPSRFGPAVHFAALMLAGVALQGVLAARSSRGVQGRRRKAGQRATSGALSGAISGGLRGAASGSSRSLARAAWLLPVLVVLEWPPAAAVRMDSVRPPLGEAVLSDGSCGAGVSFPIFDVYGADMREHLLLVQRLRQTPCLLGTPHSDYWSAYPLIQRFGLAAWKRARSEPSETRRLFEAYGAWARAIGVRWVFLGTEVPEEARARLCSILGFERVSAEVCRLAPVGQGAYPEFRGVGGA